MKRVIVSGSFDDLRAGHIRFLEESSKIGELHVLLWSDETVDSLERRRPKFPHAERQYVIEAIRFVHKVTLVTGKLDPDSLPQLDKVQPCLWVVDEKTDTDAKRGFCQSHGLEYRVLTNSEWAGFPDPKSQPSVPGRKKVIVTGCYDWFHSGHVRFFEEVSQLGDLYVVVGNDDNVRLLKGAGHPLFPQEERRYMVGSVRHVKQALVATGHGWLDAEPEIHQIKPDIYAVNEDGDKLEKRAFCLQHSILYIVLKRTPREGLTARSSTNLRGF